MSEQDRTNNARPQITAKTDLLAPELAGQTRLRAVRDARYHSLRLASPCAARSDSARSSSSEIGPLAQVHCHSAATMAKLAKLEAGARS